LEKAFSAVRRGVVTGLTAAGAESGSLKALSGQPLTHPLSETFYTQTPFRYGEHIAKFSVAPVSPELTALRDTPVDLAGKPNGLREALIDFFLANGGTWELRVQLRTNPDTMPVEDATVPWPEDESPYVAVAQVTVPRQLAWSEARAQQVDDGLSFSPWHGILAHQPLGSINRGSKAHRCENVSDHVETLGRLGYSFANLCACTTSKAAHAIRANSFRPASTTMCTQRTRFQFIDAFADGLDLGKAGFARVDPKATGRPGYAPTDFVSCCRSGGHPEAFTRGVPYAQKRPTLLS